MKFEFLKQEADRAEAESALAAADAAKIAFDSITAFFAGRASISVSPNQQIADGVSPWRHGFSLRFVCDAVDPRP